jgi:hypothetical protein
MPDPKPGKHDQALVRGADGRLYVIDKKGNMTRLSVADGKIINQALEDAEAAVSAKADGMPNDSTAAGNKVVAGGVNLCVPQMFP